MYAPYTCNRTLHLWGCVKLGEAFCCVLGMVLLPGCLVFRHPDISSFSLAFRFSISFISLLSLVIYKMVVMAFFRV